MTAGAVDPAPAGGRFGAYGGRLVPEALVAALDELASEFDLAWADPAFRAELADLLAHHAGRPTPLTEVPRFAAGAGGVRIVLKREDLAHTGSHKINNALGQALLARRMGKRRVVAETGAGQHGVATAAAAALLGLDCVVYMGEADAGRQAHDVQKMLLLGARVVPVRTGARAHKDAVSEAVRDWVADLGRTHYVFGTAAGPHPYPYLVREFQRVIGTEARAQVHALTGRLPDAVCACVGGGSNALGVFHGFLDSPGVRLYGFEAGGDGPDSPRHAAAITRGTPGVFHGSCSYLLQDDDGQTLDTYSLAGGLRYPCVGPEHAWLADSGRVDYRAVTDSQAMDAMLLLARTEGILPAIESAHALAGARLIAAEQGPGAVVLVNLSGRGDKDVAAATKWFGLPRLDGI